MENTSIKEKKRGMIKKSTIDRVAFMASFLVLPIISFLVFWLYVNLDSILMAFQRPLYDGTNRTVFSLENFQTAIKSLSEGGDLIEGLTNTLLFFFTNTVVAFPITVLMSYFIYKKIAGYRFFRAVVYLPSIITSSALVALFKYAIGTGGPIDALSFAMGKEFVYPLTAKPNAIITMLIYSLLFGFGNEIVILGGAMAGINKEMLEAGEIDGCNWFQELYKLILPSIWPTVSTFLILSVVGVLGASGPVLAFTKGHYGTMTLSYKLYSLVSGVNGSQDLHYASAIGILMTLITLPIVFLVRHVLYSSKREDEEAGR